jgi:rhamnulokinase
MKHSFFAVDLGATSGRTILGTISDKGFEMEEVNRFPNYIIEMSGHFYWDIYALYQHILEGLKLAAAREDVTISSIGIDTWGCDFALIGKDGAIIRQPYSYRDPHTSNATETFFAEFPSQKLYSLTGIQVMNFNSLFQLDTLRRNNDSALAAADKIAFIPDALSYLLTGNLVTEYTVASTSHLLNAAGKCLEPELLKAIGLSVDKFGKFVFPGTQVGTLTEEIQKITGLGAVPVVAVAGHDTASAVAAVPAESKNFAYLSSGTWSLIGIETPEPIINKDTERLNYTNEGGVEGTIRVLKNVCGMWLLERCRLEWGETSYPELIAEANESEPFRSLINPDDKVFANPASMTKAITDYCERTGQSVPQSRGEFVRCIFESLSLRYRQVLEDLQGLSTFHIDTLHVIGGGSRNDLLNQWTANAVGLPVVAGPSEATAIGNIMIQAMAKGVVSNVAEMRKEIRGSISLKTYLPQDNADWDTAYIHFKNIIS